MKTSSPVLLPLVSILLFFTGCAGLNAPAPSQPAPASAPRTAEFVYASNVSATDVLAGSISGFEIDRTTGALTPLSGFPIAADTPGSIAADPLGRHIFVLEHRVVTRSIDCSEVKSVLVSESVDPHSGSLSVADRFTLDTGCPSSLAVDPEGKNLYVATRFGQPQIRILAIGAAGTLTEIAGSPSLDHQDVLTLSMSPDGKFIYAMAFLPLSPGVLAFARDQQTGALTLSQTIEIPMVGTKLAVSPTGTFLITTASQYNFQTGLSNGEVRVFSINPAFGELTLRSTLALSSAPGAVEVSASGKFVALTSIKTVDLNPGELTIYQLDASTGSLTPVAGSSVAVGNMPSDVKFESQGDFFYTAVLNDKTVAGFSLNEHSGALGSVGHSSLADFPVQLAIVQPH